MNRFFIVTALAAMTLFAVPPFSFAAPAHGSPQAYSDRQFLSAMTGHHQEAVIMARDILKTTKDARIAQWAKAIIADQNKEIALMASMLSPLGGIDPKAEAAGRASMTEGHGSHGGHGVSPDAAFITGMLTHHHDALVMSGVALTRSDDPKVLDLAKNIIQAQAAEMREYKSWLATQKR